VNERVRRVEAPGLMGLPPRSCARPYEHERSHRVGTAHPESAQSLQDQYSADTKSTGPVLRWCRQDRVVGTTHFVARSGYPSSSRAELFAIGKRSIS
jgi:hypothetical protein